jgi:hypothetical protein
MNMNHWKLYSLVLACAISAGCTKSARSISHSGYPLPNPYCGYAPTGGPSDPAFEYRGELSEADVLGISRGEITSEAEIQRTLDTARPVKLRRDSSILLIQSGALFPDGPMVAELSKHFSVVPFSGVPTLHRTRAGGLQTESLDPESCSKSLRLTAARGGTDLIICYWGMLESENERLPTKTVSWVPLVHWVVPDEKQHMRIRLKVALLDVRSGNWSVFSPKPFTDARLSTGPRRGAVDQNQVEHLKQLAYEAAVAELLQAHSELASAGTPPTPRGY